MYTNNETWKLICLIPAILRGELEQHVLTGRGAYNKGKFTLKIRLLNLIYNEVLLHRFRNI